MFIFGIEGREGAGNIDSHDKIKSHPGKRGGYFDFTPKAELFLHLVIASVKPLHHFSRDVELRTYEKGGRLEEYRVIFFLALYSFMKACTESLTVFCAFIAAFFEIALQRSYGTLRVSLHVVDFVLVSLVGFLRKIAVVLQFFCMEEANDWIEFSWRFTSLSIFVCMRSISSL